MSLTGEDPPADLTIATPLPVHQPTVSRIHDNGPAFPEELVAGYGLQSIQDKLKLLYGNDARLLVENKPLKEVVVQIRMERLNTSPETMQPSLSAEIRPIKT